MSAFTDLLNKECKNISLELDSTALERFETYYKMLIEYNQKMNLTAITEEYDVIVKHFCDSLVLFTKYEVKIGAKIIDVGTGAGFPGVPLLIARPDIKLTLLDGLNKRLVFLSDVLSALQLDAEIVHSRAEDGATDKKYREKFDIATSRAVARLNVLLEYCLPYVKKGGVFLAMKGPAATDELADARNAMQVLGGRVVSTDEYVLSDGSQRSIIAVKKESHTHPSYPRHNSKIKKQPL